MIFLTREDIIRLNRRHIENSKSFYVESDNLRNSDSLEWVLDAIQYPLFDVDNYQTLEEKAAVLVWTIIDGHVFYDGNKRTGMSVLDIFIRLNDYQLNASDDEIIAIALKIAARTTDRDYTLEEFTEWVKDRITPDIVNSGQWTLSHFVSFPLAESIHFECF